MVLDMRKRWALSCITLLACLLLCGCQAAVMPVSTLVVDLVTPTPTPETVHLGQLEETPIPFPKTAPTPTPTPTPTPAPTLTPTPAPTPTPSPTPEATVTPKATAGAKPTATPKTTPKATAKPTATPKPAPTPEPPLLGVPPSAPTDVVIVTPKPTATPTAAPGEVLLPDGFTVSSNAKFSAEEVVLAAKTAYFEARGNGEAAYRAVICVILNRVESSLYGGGFTSVRTEVYRKSQFSVVNNSKFETTVPPMDVIGYANDILNNNNRSIPEGVLFFRSERADKTWGTKTFYETIGGNDFYYRG